MTRHPEFAARYNRAIGNPRRGRESIYTAEIAERILAGLAGGRPTTYCS
jgi:hypothetical protein